MGTLLIENCDVIDGMGNPPMRGMDVLVEQNRIARAEQAGGELATALTPGSLRLDGSHKTLMPGLIDAHCHMTYGESLTQEEQDIFTSVEASTLRAAWDVQKVLFTGVTGNSQPGRQLLHRRGCRDGIDAGRIAGPG